jgi:hypothetical protein
MGLLSSQAFGGFMRPRDWFSVGTRLIGLYTFVRAFAYFAMFAANFVLATSDSEAAKHQMQSDALFGVFHLALALVLLFCAEPITRLVFNEPEPARHSEAESDSE